MVQISFTLNENPDANIKWLEKLGFLKAMDNGKVIEYIGLELSDNDNFILTQLLPILGVNKLALSNRPFMGANCLVRTGYIDKYTIR